MYPRDYSRDKGGKDMTKRVYQKKEPKKFFTKNGKELKSYQDFEAVVSLQGKPLSEEIAVSPEKLAQETGEVNKTLVFARKFQGKLEEIAKTARQNIASLRKVKLRDVPRFSSVSLGINVALLIAVVFLLTTSHETTPKYNKYAIFSSKPLTSLVASTNFFGGDPRAASLEKILDAYNCPLAGYGKTMVKEADKNKIPYWLVAAIAFQESSCGKITPKLDGGEESYNAWGWGVWGPHVKPFEDWEDGIKTVSKYLGEKFFAKGITDTCEIMKIYTPPSDGSWCKGVDYFGEIIQNYKSP